MSGQILVCLVVNGDGLPKLPALIEALKAVPGFTTLVLSVNTRKGNAVLGDKFVTVYGPGYIEDTLCGLNFRLSARSFYQVNHAQAQRLYETAIAMAGITKNDLVLDLYCGVGTITLAMASAAGKVMGVEVVPQAIEDARDNARRNGIENAEFFCADAGTAALELEQKGIRPDIITVDPPRKGLNSDAIEAIDRMNPKRLVYISCDPATLARDTALLKERGFRLEKAIAADLFPRCSHVETVVLLSQQKPDDVIEVDLDLDELDITSAESKATYQEIKDYVLKEFGLKVSTLYISQIKRKCGIEVGEHYNFSQKENQRVPQCPKEKEDAIRAALEHFAMI